MSAGWSLLNCPTRLGSVTRSLYTLWERYTIVVHWRLMDSYDPERLSSVHKRTSSVRVTRLTDEKRTSHNP